MDEEKSENKDKPIEEDEDDGKEDDQIVEEVVELMVARTVREVESQDKRPQPAKQSAKRVRGQKGTKNNVYFIIKSKFQRLSSMPKVRMMTLSIFNKNNKLLPCLQKRIWLIRRCSTVPSVK